MSNSVLVVEDHHELLTLIEQRLTQRGYDVRCAATIHDAVAMLNEMRSPCLVFWDPTTLPMSGPLVALAGRLGIHIATIPVGIASGGRTSDGLPIITKRLTSLEAILSVLREHCSEAEDLAAS
jgi:DNA-binding NtrC family response regulator